MLVPLDGASSTAAPFVLLGERRQEHGNLLDWIVPGTLTSPAPFGRRIHFVSAPPSAATATAIALALDQPRLSPCANMVFVANGGIAAAQKNLVSLFRYF